RVASPEWHTRAWPVGCCRLSPHGDCRRIARFGTTSEMHASQTPAPSLPTLEAYGWDQTFAERFAPFAEQGLLPARVVVEYQHIYRVVTEDGEVLAVVAGRLRHRAVGRLDYPGVGDWVAIRPDRDSDRATIHGVLERKSRFVRKVSGSVVAEQVVAANVDVV